MQKTYSKKPISFRFTPIKPLTNTLAKSARFFLIALISAYQWTLSPDHGMISFFTVGKCKSRPTCSEHTKLMIKQHGVVEGVKAGWKQVKACR